MRSSHGGVTSGTLVRRLVQWSRELVAWSKVSTEWRRMARCGCILEVRRHDTDMGGHSYKVSAPGF